MKVLKVIMVVLVMMLPLKNCFAVYGVEDIKANQKLAQLNNELSNLKEQMDDMNQLLKSSVDTGSSFEEMVKMQEEIKGIYGNYQEVANEWNEIYKSAAEFEDFGLTDYVEHGNAILVHTEDALLKSVQTQGLADQISNDNDKLGALSDAIKNNNSTLGQQQISNELMAVMVEQDSRLTKMMANSNNATVAYYQQMIEKDKESRAYNKKVLDVGRDWDF